MSSEELNQAYLNGADLIQPGDLVIILLVALGIFVLVQIMNGFVNIMTARNMRRNIKIQSEISEQENRLRAEEREDIIHKFSQIIEVNIDLDDKVDYLMTYFDDLRYNSEPKHTKSKKRGKYGPRKRKEIEHKKTPSE